MGSIRNALSKWQTRREHEYFVNSSGTIDDFIAKMKKVRAFALKNVKECLGDCDENAMITVTVDDEMLKTPCPLFAPHCPLWDAREKEIKTLAAISMPASIPWRFREIIKRGSMTMTSQIRGVENWNGQNILCLYGMAGTGKSFSAAWYVYMRTLKRLKEHIDNRYKWPDMLKINVLWMSAYAVCLERSNLYEAEKTSLLILDDLGAEIKTPASTATINELFSVRYNLAAPTIITTNLNATELQERYGQRFSDRIEQNGVFLTCEEVNFRFENIINNSSLRV